MKTRGIHCGGRWQLGGRETAAAAPTPDEAAQQPLFKPNGDPRSLSAEAAAAAAALAPRGHPEAWALLERRAVDDPSTAGRAAAARALARVADGAVRLLGFLAGRVRRAGQKREPDDGGAEGASGREWCLVWGSVDE
jgi:hypothetical protein